MLKIRSANSDDSQRGEEQQDPEALKEQFFDALPGDGFTPDEESLREAILNYIET